MKNHRSISGIALCSLIAATPLLAQTGPGLVLTPPKGDGLVEFSAEGFYTPTEANITGADVDLSIFDARGRVLIGPPPQAGPDASSPIPYVDDIGFAFTQFNIDTTDAALPDRLIDMSVAIGGMFGETEIGADWLDGGPWQVGYTLGIGYAGTAPFNDGDAYYATANLFAVKPVDRDTRWLVGINYDGNRVFLPDAPLSAISYISRLNEHTTYAIGFPFSSITWKPTDKWTFDVQSLLFFSFEGKINYAVTDQLDVFAAFSRRGDAFTLSGSPDHRRLIFSQDRVELGAGLDLGNGVALTVGGGYAFAQEFDFGYDTRDPTGVRDLDDSMFIRIGLDLRF